MRQRIVRLTMGLLLPFIGLFASSAMTFGADATPTEKLLPANVLAYFTIPNVQQLRDSMEEGTAGKLMNDPELEEFIKQFKEPLAKLSEQFEEKIGLTIEQALNIPTGEVAFAVVAGNKTTPLGIVMFLDFGEHREDVDKLLELAKKAAEDEGAEIATEEIDGTEIVKFLEKKEEAAADENSDEAEGDTPEMYPCYFIKDSMIVVANHITFLENTLTRWDGKHARTFSDNIEYQYIIKRCSSEDGKAVVKWYFNPMSLVQSLMSLGAAEEPGLAMAMGFMPVLGVDRFKGMGGVVEGPSDDFEAVSRSFMFIDLPAKGILAMFQFTTTEHVPPKWVPVDASSYATFQWDIEAAYTAVSQMVDSFQGAGAFDRLIDQAAAEGPKIHIKKDVLDKLDGHFHMISDSSIDADENAGIEAFGNNMGKFLVALGLNDQSAIEAIVKKAIDEGGGFPGETREFQGTTIYESEASPGQKMAFAIVSNHLFLTNDVPKLEAVIRDDPDQKSLTDNPAYKKLAAKMPQQSAMVSFQRQDAQMEAIYEMLRSGGMSQLAAASGQDNPFSEINFSLLPPFEAIKKYFSVVGSYAEADEQGVLFTGFTMRNEDEK